MAQQTGTIRKPYKNSKPPPNKGDKFGKWIVLKDYTETKSRTPILVRCECGIEKTVGYTGLYSGNSTMCIRCSNLTPSKGNLSIIPRGFKQYLSTGLYVSEDARVYSAHWGKILTPRVKNEGGYIEVAHKYLHRLVATVYIPNDRPDRCEVNHLDKDTSNNLVSNLEWVTPSENKLHGLGRKQYKTN